MLSGGAAQASTIDYESGAFDQYSEDGFLWVSLWGGGDGSGGLGEHVHIQDSDFDLSADLYNHAGGCCSTPYQLTYSGGNFTLNSTWVNFQNGPGTWTSSAGGLLVDPGGSNYNLVFGAGFENVSWVRWDVDDATSNDGSIDDTVVNEQVPEPASMLLFGTALTGLFAARRRGRKGRAQ